MFVWSGRISFWRLLGIHWGYLVTAIGSCNYYNSDTCNYKFLENATDQRTGSIHE